MLKCPHCKKDIPDSLVTKHFASIGGKKYSQSLTKEQRVERARKAGQGNRKQVLDKD